jgi:putative FmdB family regulatory protein
MPAYDFVCRDCGHPFGVRMSITAYSEGEPPPCPSCGSKSVERRFTAVNVVTAGRGGSSAACSPGAFT